MIASFRWYLFAEQKNLFTKFNAWWLGNERVEIEFFYFSTFSISSYFVVDYLLLRNNKNLAFLKKDFFNLTSVSWFRKSFPSQI